MEYLYTRRITKSGRKVYKKTTLLASGYPDTGLWFVKINECVKGMTKISDLKYEKETLLKLAVLYDMIDDIIKFISDCDYKLKDIPDFLKLLSKGNLDKKHITCKNKKIIPDCYFQKIQRGKNIKYIPEFNMNRFESSGIYWIEYSNKLNNYIVDKLYDIPKGKPVNLYPLIYRQNGKSLHDIATFLIDKIALNCNFEYF